MPENKNIQLLLTGYLLIFTVYAFTQDSRNSGFTKPVNLPFNLAGSFGEPRKDHFHSGIDIKTNGVEGEPVFAIYDGYISRIRVSPYGYGRAIYITHPNGLTSVYGHLSRFNETTEKYVFEQHYKAQKSELDLSFDAAQFPVKQNDNIAFSGNTGGSTAPHLHFEIRDNKTEFALNPLNFYPESYYIDTIAPQLNTIKVNDLYKSVSTKYPLKKMDGYYTTEKPIEFYNSNAFNFSLEGFDKQDTSENKNGIYKIEVKDNEKKSFQYIMNEIDFDKTRMCNLFVDYNEMENDNGYFYNCFQSEGNTFPIYSTANKQYFKISNNEKIEISVYCYDYNENKTKIQLIFIQHKTEFTADEVADAASDYFANKNINSTVSDSTGGNKFKIKFPMKCLYKTASISVKENRISTAFVLSYKYEVSGYKIIPLQKSAKIEIQSGIKKNRNKIIIVRQSDKRKETALKTTFDKNKFYAETKELGTFYLKYDTTKPTIEILNLNAGTLNDKVIQVKILDNLSGIKSYDGFIDNKWVNFYYDAKNNLIQYNIDEYCMKGEHILKLNVKDNVGNKTFVQQKFKY